MGSLFVCYILFGILAGRKINVLSYTNRDSRENSGDYGRSYSDSSRDYGSRGEYGNYGHRSTNDGPGPYDHGSRSYRDSYCADSNLKIPNYIRSMEPADPYRGLGKWYSYSEWRGGPTGEKLDYRLAYNTVVYLTRLSNLTVEPSTNTPGLLVEELLSNVNPADKVTCQNQAAVGYLTTKGEYRGKIFDRYNTGDPNKVFIANYPNLILSTDYDTYALIYLCFRYNLESGLCAAPVITLITRTRPDEVTSETEDYINAETNRLLGEYCFDASMMTKTEWRSGLPNCPVSRPQDSCYIDLLGGMLYMAGNEAAYNELYS